MLQEFNGILYLGVYILLLLGTLYYTYSTIVQTEAFLKKYGIHSSGAFMVRFAGTFLIPISLLMIYMLFDGISGNWIFFVFGVLQAITATLVGYWTVEKSSYRTVNDEKISSEGYLAPLGFVIAWLVLIYGVSDKIYS